MGLELVWANIPGTLSVHNNYEKLLSSVSDQPGISREAWKRCVSPCPMESLPPGWSAAVTRV